MARDVENPAYRYGQWAGNTRGHAQHQERCVQEVHPAQGWIHHQCSRKRKVGLYCKQHAPKGGAQ